MAAASEDDRNGESPWRVTLHRPETLATSADHDEELPNLSPQESKETPKSTNLTSRNNVEPLGQNDPEL